jgi:hypothetical protein
MSINPTKEKRKNENEDKLNNPLKNPLPGDKKKCEIW